MERNTTTFLRLVTTSVVRSYKVSDPKYVQLSSQRT